MRYEIVDYGMDCGFVDQWSMDDGSLEQSENRRSLYFRALTRCGAEPVNRVFGINHVKRQGKMISWYFYPRSRESGL
jgi:hypothetical protein